MVAGAGGWACWQTALGREVRGASWRRRQLAELEMRRRCELCESLRSRVPGRGDIDYRRRASQELGMFGGQKGRGCIVFM